MERGASAPRFRKDDRMTTTTTLQPGVGDTTYENMSDDMIQELMQGAPESFSEAGEPADPIVPINSPAVEGSLPGVAADKVLLVNLDFVNETVFFPLEDGSINPRDKEKFSEGHLITDRASADKVLAKCPYVYEEPKTGELFTHAPSGFHTRNAAGFVKYVSYWTDNNKS